MKYQHRRRYQFNMLVVLAIIALLLGILILAIGKVRQSLNSAQKNKPSQAQNLSQEEKDRLFQQRLQEGRIKAEQRRAEQLQKQQQEEIERNQLIEKEKLEQEAIQKEYAPLIQPLSFIITPWQYNREQEFAVFVLYDITNKQEYLVVKTGLGTPNSSVSITPRYKNPNP